MCSLRDPEMTEMPDTGCAGVSNSCFTCPLPMCRYEVSLFRQMRDQRDAKIRRARGRGMSAVEIATRLGLSVRVVFRALSPRKEAA